MRRVKASRFAVDILTTARTIRIRSRQSRSNTDHFWYDGFA